MLVQEPLLLPASPNLKIPTHRVNKPEIVPPLVASVIGDRFRGQNLSEEASKLLLSSWRQKTSKSYDSLFGK